MIINWLICVARNTCKNKLKFAWFKKHVDLREMPYYDEYKDSNVLKKVMQTPLKYREIIYLYYYEAYTTVEIASIINKKEATIHTSLANDFIVNKGQFVVFYPEDGHKACIAVDDPCQVKKIVLKVALD